VLSVLTDVLDTDLVEIVIYVLATTDQMEILHGKDMTVVNVLAQKVMLGYTLLSPELMMLTPV
jgi:hypothetical protein